MSKASKPKTHRRPERLDQVPGAREQVATAEVDASLWSRLRLRFSDEIRDVVDDLERAPTLTELALMELAYHLEDDERARAADLAASRVVSDKDRLQRETEARQLRKAMAKSRDSMRQLRALLGTTGSPSTRAVRVPAGLVLVGTPDVDEELVE